MARETKLGMLVGLGFIICFAIILENRGRRDRVTPQMPHELVTQPTVTANPSTPAVAERRAREYGERTSKRSPAVADTRGTSSRPDGRLVKPKKSGRNSLAGSNNGARRGGERRSPKPAREADTEIETPATTPPRTLAQLLQGAALPDATVPTSPSPSRSSSSEAAPANQRVASLAARTPEPAPPASRPEPRAAVIQGRPYTVQKGDSLSKIASRNYGSASKSVVDAIFDANRAVMPSPNDLKAGQKLVLPEIEGLSQPSDASEAAPSRNPQPAPSEQIEERDLRYYQIQKGDRYATIARDQLGDVNRWREIAELNLDIFPDPAKIRYGVRIRLPAGSAERSEGPRS